MTRGIAHIYPHTKFGRSKLSRLKGNLCGDSSGGVTVLNPKYPRLSSGEKFRNKERNVRSPSSGKCVRRAKKCKTCNVGYIIVSML